MGDSAIANLRLGRYAALVEVYLGVATEVRRCYPVVMLELI
jgi:hypothetical protein